MMISDRKGSLLDNAETHSQNKEWDDVSCPICMEHPHNAVLLICGSHENGCRSYICDTSYRHSNCLDRFKKMTENPPQVTSSTNNNFNEELTGQRTSETLESFVRGPTMRRNIVETLEDYNLDGNSEEIAASLLEALEENNQIQEPEAPTRAHGGPSQEIVAEETSSKSSYLNCPLCRGNVIGWMIVKEARRYWDLKPRSCSRESCSFSGTYRELRGHARRVHPTTRPSDVDPTRQRAWRHLEHQQEYGDIVSAIRSAMPGAVVLGDYVLDTSTDLHSETSAPFWSTFFLFHMMGSPIRSLDDSRASPRGLRRRRNSPERHRNLWGENLLGLEYDDNDDDDDDGNHDADDDDDNVEFLIPSRRRRITRSSRTGDNL